ncbi:phosphatidylglycerophosphatase A [Breznakia sp. PF5-3]|uniref:phosphatidylglycerophosphatase A family protein n=1 Tax=unclassified Breznakia TaxID=2623764 RepID=UPI002404A25C|nr:MULTISPECIES: phosphatidylglycerophosphatase A [unclassified Breznakia]MDF9824224.1 phosphatidylglycerophosphatase A [Breznakia sp. PM6-1]MDF9835022.1 phosphatidylglycerophosphatase A [Breznakia sp. PF5-3]MDF9837267.1 phosphatidylglycerophosphatase A [Breznakia sp. PFB2-8]MDF9859257.1 phosphatidylglycerophosphatase A [Breznakia sp. PH5-24]
MYEKCIALLKERGVEIEDIVDCVFYLQRGHIDDTDAASISETVKKVIDKREVQHAIITGICLDKMSEQRMLVDKDLEDILNRDESLYGIDEVLAYGICNLYGSIALTNFGYIDKAKYGIIKELNDHMDNHNACHTFLDDIVGAIAASAASRIAHNKKGPEDETL